MTDGVNPTGTPGAHAIPFDRRAASLKRRLVKEASLAIVMLESALDALWRLDADKARRVRLDDDQVDSEEVDIERECFELLALHHPFARDFRFVTFILRVNADVERVADHASSIAKAVVRISKLVAPGAPPPAWPTALRDLGQRVPAICHELVRIVLDEDAEGARRLMAGDDVIDELEKRLFDEAMESMHADDAKSLPVGMLIYRIGRELERVGDLMKNIAEDVVYLATGAIIRHEKRRPTPAPKAP